MREVERQPVSHMADEIRAIVVCPRCHGELIDEPGMLRCEHCRLRYRVDDGVAVLLLDEAIPDQAQSVRR